MKTLQHAVAQATPEQIYENARELLRRLQVECDSQYRDYLEGLDYRVSERARKLKREEIEHNLGLNLARVAVEHAQQQLDAFIRHLTR